ncbi:MAG: HupE/UreJ family protein, partial [Cellvibrionaceae bacterium]|nr:HupE/UreJ family protein [Cellvibrionaceae bacterium]
VKLSLQFPPECQLQFKADTTVQGGFRSQGASLSCPANTLQQGQLSIDGLESSLIDVLVKVQFLNQPSLQFLLGPKADSYQFATGAEHGRWAYAQLGFEHILEGIDHLLFLLALLLLIDKLWLLIKVITSFTLAHSITLALASLGLVNVPSGPVEALIALSIMLMAAEALGRGGQFRRQPWLMTGLFGLLHGLGFAGALSDIGLPADDIPMALLLFNLGIEAGQLVFIGACIGLALAANKLWQKLGQANLAQSPYPIKISAYGIGAIAGFWFIERSLGVVA